MFYRLIEDHSALGWIGKVITPEEYDMVYFAHKPLYEPRQEDDTYYAKITYTGVGKSPVEYIVDTRRDYETVTARLCSKYKTLEANHLRNLTDISNVSTVDRYGNTLKITFIKSWQTQTKLSDTEQDSSSPGK